MGLQSAILIIIALLIAWYLGYRAKVSDQAALKVRLPRDYLKGLNYLINEEPDKAVDIFIKMLEVDSSTVETHLALGKLFRRRGEVDRAIRIHQNLIARPQLAKMYREQSLFELGQDYLSAGMLDRAERVFLEVSTNKEYAVAALRSLLDIYNQEKSWDKSISVASKLGVATRDQGIKIQIAQYHCELGDAALAKHHGEEAVQHWQEALRVYKACARASLSLARWDMQHGRFEAALRHLKRVKDQDPDYLSEAIEPLAICYEKLQKEDEMVSYLLRVLDEIPKLPIVIILSDRIRRWKGDKVAANFVADYIRRYPSIEGLHLYIDLKLTQTVGQAHDDLTFMQSVTSKLSQEKSDYQCVSCGFSGKSLHWQCPGCKEWNSIKPMHSVDTVSA